MLYIIGYIIMIIVSASVCCKLDVLNSPYKEYDSYAFMGLFWWIVIPMLLLSYIVKFIDEIILK